MQKTIDEKLISYTDAVSLIKSGSVLMVGGFMGTGAPHKLIDCINKTDVNNLTVICNDAGFGHTEMYKGGYGAGKLIINKKVSTIIATHIGLNPEVTKQNKEGIIDIKIFPQGSLIEKIRCGGFGLGGVLTKTGIGSDIVEKGKQIIEVKGEKYLLEEAIRGDIAIVGAKKADKYGNIVFHGATRNFGELMVYACDNNIIEVEEIVDVLPPDFVHIPGAFVKNIVCIKND